MNDLLDPDKDKQPLPYHDKGLYVKEDDQDWGSSGMNDIQENSE